jgi:hypothetical protein
MHLDILFIDWKYLLDVNFVWNKNEYIINCIKLECSIVIKLWSLFLMCSLIELNFSYSLCEFNFIFDPLFYAIGLYVYFVTVLVIIMVLCNTLKLGIIIQHCSFCSELLWLFHVFVLLCECYDYFSISVIIMYLEFWWGLHWISKLT